MQRCFDLARLGAQHTSPNPLVGAVITHNDRIIGEGFHQVYGGAHAEVHAMASVSPADRYLIPEATMYVSLEPCCHHGKTPPCTDMLIDAGIKRVVISVTDPNPKVHGRGIAQLREAGIEVVTGVLESQGSHLLRNFHTAISRQRPYVVLKFAQSADRFIGAADRPIWLSNSYEKIMVHKMRSEFDAILVGTNTAVIDNPRLTTREYFGGHPLRVCIDRNERIPRTHHLFDDSAETVIFTLGRSRKAGDRTSFVQVPDDNLLHSCLAYLHERRILSLMVEGGASLLKSFAEAELWDEAWVVTTDRDLREGVRAPTLHGSLRQIYTIDRDQLHVLSRVGL